MSELRPRHLASSEPGSDVTVPSHSGTRFCSSCGTPVASETLYCPQCGHHLAASAGGPPSPGGPGSEPQPSASAAMAGPDRPPRALWPLVLLVLLPLLGAAAGSLYILQANAPSSRSEGSAQPTVSAAETPLASTVGGWDEFIAHVSASSEGLWSITGPVASAPTDAELITLWQESFPAMQGWVATERSWLSSHASLSCYADAYRVWTSMVDAVAGAVAGGPNQGMLVFAARFNVTNDLHGQLQAAMTAAGSACP
jgi:hypothetical protein